MNAARFDDLLRRLVEAEVEFVVIGGLALGALGVVRGTKDVDVVVDPDPANLKRVAELANGQQVAIETKRTAARPRDLVDLVDSDATEG